MPVTGLRIRIGFPVIATVCRRAIDNRPYGLRFSIEGAVQISDPVGPRCAVAVFASVPCYRDILPRGHDKSCPYGFIGKLCGPKFRTP
jgi:hypothetical protein